MVKALVAKVPPLVAKLVASVALSVVVVGGGCSVVVVGGGAT